MRGLRDDCGVLSRDTEAAAVKGPRLTTNHTATPRICRPSLLQCSYTSYTSYTSCTSCTSCTSFYTFRIAHACRCWASVPCFQGCNCSSFFTLGTYGLGAVHLYPVSTVHASRAGWTDTAA